MANYHNAVSDKLVVSFFKNIAVYNVFSKENALKWSAFQDDSTEFPKVLESAIFSSSHCICALTNMVLVPGEAENPEQFYALQFGVNPELSFDVQEDIKIAYKPSECFLAVKSKLVNYKVESDVGIAISYFKKKKQPNSLYFYEADNILSVLVYKAGSLVLANRYTTENLDELFYYVMYAVEQLDLSVEHLYLECISTKGMHENLQAMFKNYLPPLQLTPVNWEYVSQNEGQTVKNDTTTLAAFFSQCVL